MDAWGNYGDFTFQAQSVLFLLAWNLLALNVWQEVRKLKRKRKEKAQWESSSQL
jgi:hypothetical protein